MAKSITQNEIVFSNVKTAENEGILELSAGIKVSQTDGVDPNYGGIINAIDIDWNGADFSGATAPTSEPGIINTSGDLIKAVKWASTAGPVTSVNGQTGAVSITIPDAPVTSVNGQTGAVTLSIPNAQIQTNTENISNLQTDVASLTNIVSNIFSNLSTE